MAVADPQQGRSGLQHEIVYRRHRAVITEVGATLREYAFGDRAVVDGFGLDEICHDGRGQVLAPWPNRLGDGRYDFESVAGRAALDEPSASNAIHGLVRWLPWSVDSKTSEAVSLGCVLHPQPAYPWRLALKVGYQLGSDGLTVTATAVNEAASPAPFGVGFHPYLTLGGTTIDEARLRLSARRRVVTDARGLPVGSADVAGTEFDFQEPRLLGATALDTCFGDLERDGGGTARVDLEQGGYRVTVWMDRAFHFVMAYTADKVSPQRARKSIAVEPMSCPPDALRSGTDLVRLVPGGAWSGRWGIYPH
jgi:aldose 1-epimerase